MMTILIFVIAFFISLVFLFESDKIKFKNEMDDYIIIILSVFILIYFLNKIINIPNITDNVIQLSQKINKEIYLFILTLYHLFLNYKSITQKKLNIFQNCFIMFNSLMMMYFQPTIGLINIITYVLPFMLDYHLKQLDDKVDYIIFKTSSNVILKTISIGTILVFDYLLMP